MCLQSLMKFHHCLFKILRKNQNVVDKELQRAITLTEQALSPYFSIINVHFVDINVFAKFDEITPLPFPVIEKPKRHGWMYGQTDGQCEKSIPPHREQFAGEYNK